MNVPKEPELSALLPFFPTCIDPCNPPVASTAPSRENGWGEQPTVPYNVVNNDTNRRIGQERNSENSTREDSFKPQLILAKKT